MLGSLDLSIFVVRDRLVGGGVKKLSSVLGRFAVSMIVLPAYLEADDESSLVIDDICTRRVKHINISRSSPCSS